VRVFLRRLTFSNSIAEIERRDVDPHELQISFLGSLRLLVSSAALVFPYTPSVCALGIA
jgi:hypothetical protein